MTAKEARQLLVGTVVAWDDDPTDMGTVRRLSAAAFWVDWANGQRGWIHYDDAKKIGIR